MTSRLLPLADAGDEVGCAAAVTPFVVVPAHDLEHVAIHDLRPVGGEQRTPIVADDVGRADRVFGITEEALERTRFGSGLHRGVDFFLGNVLFHNGGQVDYAAGRHGHTQRDAGQLALQGGDHQTDGLRGTRRGGNDILSGTAGTIRILVRLILSRLIVGVGVNGSHQTFDNAELFVQHLGDGSQAVRGAARVRDALEFRLELIVVDAQHAGQVSTVFGGGAEHNSLGTGFQVGVVACFAVFGATGENACAFDNHIDAHVFPGEFGGIADGQGFDLLAVDDQVIGVVTDGARKPAVGAVVFEQRGQHLVVGQVVDGYDLEFARPGVKIAEGQTANASKSVDCYSNCHCFFSYTNLEIDRSPTPVGLRNLI
jgi:hypothetical protein